MIKKTIIEIKTAIRWARVVYLKGPRWAFAVVKEQEKIEFYYKIFNQAIKYTSAIERAEHYLAL